MFQRKDAEYFAVRQAEKRKEEKRFMDAVRKDMQADGFTKEDKKIIR